MNNQRRRQIREIIQKITVLLCEVEDVIEEIEAVESDEEEYRDNIPENLVNSERYERAEAAVDALSNARDSLESSRDSMDEAVSSLEEACE